MSQIPVSWRSGTVVDGTASPPAPRPTRAALCDAKMRQIKGDLAELQALAATTTDPTQATFFADMCAFQARRVEWLADAAALDTAALEQLRATLERRIDTAHGPARDNDLAHLALVRLALEGA